MLNMMAPFLRLKVGVELLRVASQKSRQRVHPFHDLGLKATTRQDDAPIPSAVEMGLS